MESSEHFTTGLISQRHFAPKCLFLAMQVGILNVVLSEYLDKSHNFTNLIFRRLITLELLIHSRVTAMHLTRNLAVFLFSLVYKHLIWT